jgi:hypothetical protein
MNQNKGQKRHFKSEEHSGFIGTPYLGKADLELERMLQISAA